MWPEFDLLASHLIIFYLFFSQIIGISLNLKEVWITTVYITAIYNLYICCFLRIKNIHLFSVNIGNSNYGHKQNKKN